MMKLVAESLIKFPEGNMWDLRDRFVRWIRSGPPGTGRTTRESLKLAAKLDPKKDDLASAARQVWLQTKKASNGSLMRCAPIGLVYHKRPDKLKDISDQSCTITHYAPACRASTLAFNRILAAILNGEITDKASMPAVFETVAREVAPIDPETAKILRQIPGLRKDQVKTSSASLDTLQIALWALYNHTNFEEAVVTVVNMGGDADTNGAVTGVLMGALYGEKAIPKRWLGSLLEKNAIGRLSNRLYRAAKV
jgi:ADP-ribosyl-[dinitrogen reductase] hydrolase